MKALLKHKIKKIVPLLAVGIIALLFGVIRILVNTTDVNPYDIEMEYSTYFVENICNALKWSLVAFIIVAIGMGLLLTKEYGNSEQEAFLTGLPFKKKHRFLVTFMPGLLFFVICTVVLLVTVIISHRLTYEYYNEIYMTSPIYELLLEYDGIGNGIMRVLQIMTALIMLYSISFFAGVVGRNEVVKVFIIIIICVFPFYIIPGITTLTGDVPFLNDLKLYSSLIGLFESFAVNIEGYGRIYFFEALIERTVTTGIISIVYVIASYWIINMKDRNSGNILVGKHSDAVFSLAAGIYVAFFFPLFKDIIGITIGVVVILMLVSFGVSVFILYRYISKGNKYNYLNGKGESNNEK